MQPKIQKISLQSEIIKCIQNHIKENELSSGDKLPSQGEMSEIIGVSRTCLREAIKTLEAQGVLEVRNGKGVDVGQNYGSDVIQISISFHKKKEYFLDTLEVRSILEREILKMVVHRITDEEIAQLGKMTDILMEKYRKKEDKAEEDKQFHYMIYSCCHNDVMIRIMHSIMVFWNDPLDIVDAFEEGMPYHQKLYEAIANRDLKGALLANDEIIKDIRRDLEAAIQK